MDGRMTESERNWIEEEWWDDPFSDCFAVAGEPLIIWEVPFIRLLGDELAAVH